MPLIKRYPNRKLYNTEEKKYITLDEIAVLIRKGEEIHVMDHVTNEDLTSLTLSQVILEEEKRHAGFLPGSILASLVRSGGEAKNSIFHALVSSFGFSYLFNEEVGRRIDELVVKGRITADEAARWQDLLLTPGTLEGGREKSPEKIREEGKADEGILQRVLKVRGIPTRGDIEHLSAQLDEISNLIDDISKGKP